LNLDTFVIRSSCGKKYHTDLGGLHELSVGARAALDSTCR
jgi:hypothetical protein